jgi:acetylornithine deacetylase/succinyl-diaminopimelate desuccinylase-like protein
VPNNACSRPKDLSSCFEAEVMEGQMNASSQVSESFSENPVQLLQRLIRYDTTNPPGNEADCVGFLNTLLRDSGVETTLLAKTPQRPNLIARLKGQGSAPPLLLYGHVDVVTTANQLWQHPPFDGRVVDGFVWGRGALDMKGGVAMMVAAFLRAKAQGVAPPADVVLAIVSDEEAAGDFGAKFLVESHPDLFGGIRHALGEFGGFTFFLGKQRFYPIMVAEKQICWMRATVRGQGGHGSLPVRGGAMAKLARAILQLDRHNLPVHITPVVRLMFRSLGSAAPMPTGFVLQSLLNPRLTNTILGLLGSQGRTFGPLFRNSVSVTILSASDKINVIPSEVSFELDGRLLPGSQPDDMVAELRPILGAEVELEVLRHDPGPAEPDMSLFDTLAGILREADPDGVPVPLLLSAVTDARFFSRLGIQTYGFLPMQLPQGFDFSRTIHAADERLPAEAVEFGASAILKVIQRYQPDRAA